MLGKTWKKIQDVLNGILSVLMIIVLGLIFLQVLVRYVFSYSIPWSEELSRFLFIYVIFLSLNITIREKLPIRIDFLDNALKGKAKMLLRLLVEIISGIILSVLAYSGYKLFLFGFKSSSPGLGLPLYAIYIVLPIGYALSVIETVHQIVLVAKGGREKC